MKAKVVKFGSKQAGSLQLPKDIFAQEVNEKLLAQAVRVYRANKRQGTAKVKSRGEVRGSGRKIWRQKGTGRARHGDRYAPIFVGGGVAHGPTPRDWSLKLSKKMRRKALFGALSLRAQEGIISVVDSLDKIKPKTREFVAFLRNELKLEPGEETILLVGSKLPDNVRRGVGNIPDLQTMPVRTLNTYDVLAVKKIIFTKSAVKEIEKIWK